MKIGYACQCLSNELPSFRTCTKKYVTEELLNDIIAHNLKVMDEILDYNKKHGIELFRISSDLIPFGSSPINCIDWRSMYRAEFQSLGAKARRYGMRMTMHPGQYTILNTPNQTVLTNSILDLRYHCDILNLMGMDQRHKLILHIGGIYGDQELAVQRFLQAFRELDEDIQQRLIIENDDRYYTLADVLAISEQIHIPVIFDNLHHELLPSLDDYPLYEVLELVRKTWNDQDGRMKIHYSQQDPEKRKGAHAQYLDGMKFMKFCTKIAFMDIDMMMEIKTKNLAALQALDLLHPDHCDKNQVWHQYRYLVLRHSMAIFTQLEQQHKLLSIERIYELVLDALKMPQMDGAFCYQYIYQEWLPMLDEKSKQKLERAMMRNEQNKLSEQGLKNAFFSAAFITHHQNDYFFL